MIVARCNNGKFQHTPEMYGIWKCRIMEFELGNDVVFATVRKKWLIHIEILFPIIRMVEKRKPKDHKQE